MFTNHIFNIMNKPDLALHNLQWLICLKIKLNQTKQLRICVKTILNLGNKCWSLLVIIQSNNLITEIPAVV